MKNVKLKYILLVFIAGYLVSCNDDSLTEVNPNESSTGSFWKNLNDTNIGLAAAYNALLDEDIYAIRNEALRSDMGWPGFGRPINDDDELKSYYQHTYTSSSGYVQNKWSAIYKAIFRANQVIEGLNNIEGSLATEDEMLTWKTQMGQARFIRGLMHFYLHSAYNNGSVIIRDEVPITPEDFNKALSPASEVLAFFRADLEYAYNNLPAQYEENSDKGRATKGAAATILGTSLLYEADYSAAMVYFDDVINNVSESYGYKLVNDMSLLFTDAGEFNDESIFELNYTIDYRTDIGVWEDNVLSQQISLLSASNKGPLMPAWIINEYKKDALDPLDDRNYFDDEESPTGRTLRPVSHRVSAMAGIVEDDISLYYGEVTGAKLKLSRNGWGFGMYKKYTNHDIYENEGEIDPRGSRASGRNVILNRLADVYLMQAECYIKTGDIAQALELINRVRYRWALTLIGPINSRWGSSSFDEVDYDENTLMDRLMYIEKPLELSLEGHQIRWNDMRRWGITSDIFTKLSNSTFYATRHEPVNLAGNTVRKNSSSISDVDPGGLTGLDIVDYEYDETVNNYNSSIHDYLPIPLNEVMRNPNIN